MIALTRDRYPQMKITSIRNNKIMFHHRKKFFLALLFIWISPACALQFDNFLPTIALVSKFFAGVSIFAGTYILYNKLNKFLQQRSFVDKIKVATQSDSINDDELEKINDLLKKKINLEHRFIAGPYNTTALIEAVRSKNLKLFNLLLEYKADVNVARWYLSHVSYQVYYPNKAKFSNKGKILLEIVTNRILKEKITQTENVDYIMLEKLLKAGAKFDDNTYLIEAIGTKNLPFVRLSLKYNIDVNSNKNRHRCTPIRRALEILQTSNENEISPEIFSYLTDQGAKFEKPADQALLKKAISKVML